jgi:radical SAM superfamily enzyme YgiQ (UPF0313 family)
MKVLFVNPPNKPFTSRQLLIEPIDLLSLASYIQKLGHEVKVLDMDVKRMMPEQVMICLQEFLPEVVVIPFDYHVPLHTTESIAGVFEIAKQAKKLKAKVLVGGKIATYFPNKFIYPGSPVEVTISGEMEHALKELLSMDNWQDKSLSAIPGIAYWNENNIKQSQGHHIFNLNQLPIPDRRLVDLADYINVRSLLSSRGCSMQCSFCATPGFWGAWRGREPQQVVEEIALLVNNYGAKRVLFLDDNALFDKERMRKICRLIIEQKLKVNLGCLAALNLFDETIMRLMYKAGFRWIHYGAESGSSRILKNVGKKVNRERIKDVIRQTQKIGFRVRTSWIIDLPGMTEKSLDETRELILASQSDEIRLHYLALRLGSRLYNEFAGEVPNPPSQYIHGDKPNLNATAVEQFLLVDKVNALIAELGNLGYILIRNQRDLAKLNRRSNRTKKIVSLCPLRYDLGWG